MTAGRPTDYSQEILDQSRDYIIFYKKHGDMIPSVAGLSSYLGIARSTIYDWASQEDKKEFSDILQHLLSEQERILLNKGLNGQFNPSITKLALGKHGYTDKADVTSDGKAISLSFDSTFNKDE